MRGLLALVSPPTALVDRVNELATLLDVIVVEVDADEISDVIELTVDPLGELRVDGLNIALSATAEAADG